MGVGGNAMDRYDEKKDRTDSDDLDRSSDLERKGDVLGLGGTIRKMPGDPSASNDAASMARRRERARESDETRSSQREDPYQQSPGAAGIDMGSGGRGTDVSGE